MSAQRLDLPAPPSTPFAPTKQRDATLPLGVRRFHLDPLRHREFATARVLRPVLTTALGLVVCLAPFVLIGALSFGAATVVFVVMTAGAATPGLLFARRTDSPQLLTYELLVGTRVVRRTVAGSQPAEVLRPEVNAIVETSDGLWLSCDVPRRALFVSRAVDGYDDVRAELSKWREIQPLGPGAAWRHATIHGPAQASRDAIQGTALASDPSLGAELELVRGASSTSWENYVTTPVLRRLRRVAFGLPYDGTTG
jgi:hypothetical protein